MTSRYTHAGLRHSDQGPDLLPQDDEQPPSTRATLPSSPKSYGPVNVTGGFVHQGNYIHVSTEDPVQREIDQILGSFRFPEINLRVNQVEDAHRETFEWAMYPRTESVSADHDSPGSSQRFPQSDEFCTWLISDEPTFWIAGKPGSGKSTLMKFLSFHDRSRSLLEYWFHDRQIVILNHFFWLQGSDMQRNLKGCLCTLIYQILQTNEKLVLSTLRKDPSVRRKHNVHDWSVSALQSLLFDLLSTNGLAFGIFLDGLDEYDTRGDVEALTGFVRRLSEVSAVKLCCSSRQENVFERVFSRTPKLRLQDLTHDDMYNMVRTKLEAAIQETEASFTDYELGALSGKIAHKAEGVFLWAVIALRTLSTGIWDCDGLLSLLERLAALPTEMEDLCRHILIRVNGRRDLHPSLLYLTLAKIRPISLLTFTLAADEQLLRKFTHNCELLTPFEAEHLLSACRTMEVKIRAKTAGILEVIYAPPHDDSFLEPGGKDESFMYNKNYAGAQDDASRLGLCICPGLLDRHRCFASLPCFKELWKMHHKSIQYMHRDIAEKFNLAQHMDLDTTYAGDLHLQAQKKFITATLVEHKLGCRCRTVERTRSLCLTLRIMGEDHATATMKHMLDRFDAWSTSPLVQGCYYGWGHELLRSVWQDAFEIDDYNSDASSVDPSVLDLPGLMAWLGYLNFFKAIDDEASSWSPYYKGYLCACATKRAWSRNSDHEPLYTGKSRVISWLIESGADVLSPQIARPTFGHDTNIHIIMQTTMVHCWSFLMHLLKEPLVARAEKLRICDILVPLFLAQKCRLEDVVIWCVDMGAKTEVEIELVSHYLNGHDLQSVLRTPIEKLQAYTLHCVSHLRGDGQGKVLHPSLESGDVLCIDWKRRGMYFGYTPFNETNILEVRELRGTSFSTIELSALEVLGHQGKAQLKSLEHLVRKLKDLRRHQNAAAYPESESPIMSYSNNIQVAKLIRSFNMAPHRSFYVFEHDSNVVPPDTNKEIHDGQWYEHGALREWHERRRRKMWHPVSWKQSPIDEYEKENRAIRPSYLSQLEGGDSTSGSESRPESSNEDQDDIASSAVGSFLEINHIMTSEGYVDAGPSPRSTSHQDEYASGERSPSVNLIRDEMNNSRECTTDNLTMLIGDAAHTVGEDRPESDGNSNVHLTAANQGWKSPFTRPWNFSKWPLATYGRTLTAPITDRQHEDEDLD